MSKNICPECGHEAEKYDPYRTSGDTANLCYRCQMEQGKQAEQHRGAVRHYDKLHFDRVDVLAETKHAARKAEETGYFHKHPEAVKKFERLIARAEAQPRQVVDYQKVGHPIERN